MDGGWRHGKEGNVAEMKVLVSENEVFLGADPRDYSFINEIKSHP